MYSEIKLLKEIGLKKSQIARKLNISRPTINKYLKMSPDEFEGFIKEMKVRKKKPEPYSNEILSWLKEFPDLSAAQVFDWLEEKYKILPFSEETLRRYIRFLRQKHNILKIPKTRDYEGVEELPMGKQMQVDFGEIKVKKEDGKYIRLYVMCFVLSYSRYKYCEWQSRPFTTSDIIRIHENAFEYYGGMPEEIVYDQDHVILVSENHGDLIFTREFAGYHQRRKFKIYMCRKVDPESKGKVENVVGFVKNNFARHRTFYNIDRWNEDCISWLERRGNGKVHGTTRKVPAQVFLEEKKCLKPILDKIKTKSSSLSLTYQVKKDNTVPIKGNRYSVPKGTYKGPQTYVKVSYISETELIIRDIDTDKKLAQYQIPADKGNLVKNNNHKRDNNVKISALIDQIADRFADPVKAKCFMENIRKEKSRYIRDQLNLIQSTMKNNSLESNNKALEFCVKNHLYRATDFQDAVAHYEKDKAKLDNDLVTTEPVALTLENLEKIKVIPKIRDMSEYINAFGRK
jgi:transposase